MASVGVRSAAARILNALMEAINSRPRLPRFLVIIMDFDIMKDFDFDDNLLKPYKDFYKVLHWLFRQVNLVLRRKKLLISDCRLGAMYGDHPTVIAVKLLRRVTTYSSAMKMGKMCMVRTKFNEAMNKAASEFGFRIMNITDCNEETDFDVWGNLTERGKTAYWHQMDRLIKQFDLHKIQLLPAKPESTRHQKFKEANQKCQRNEY